MRILPIGGTVHTVIDFLCCYQAISNYYAYVELQVSEFAATIVRESLASSDFLVELQTALLGFLLKIAPANLNEIKTNQERVAKAASNCEYDNKSGTFPSN